MVSWLYWEPHKFPTVHPLMTMTTATLKPRPVRKRKDTTYKPMTEQTSTLQTVTKVQSHLPDYQLIDRNALWDDFQTRLKINNYEVTEAFKQLKEVVNQTHEVMLPYVDQAVERFNEFRSR